MTNWHDPAVEVAESLAIVKIFHVFAGMYIWEFVLNLDYEYSIITGKRKYNRSVLLYLGCRWSTLLITISNFVDLDTPDEMNCQAWAVMASVFAWVSIQSAACLIILRIHALWKRKRIVVVTTFVVWFAIIAGFVYDATSSVIRTHQDQIVCGIDNMVDVRISIITVFIADLVLLSLMLFGVLRWKQSRLIGGGIWQVMYTQGPIYVLIATLADVPLMTFLVLNLNEPMDEMFLFSFLVIMSTGALRMHRGLVDSTALNSLFQGLVGSTRPSTIRFARPDFREEDINKARGTVLDPCPTATPQQILCIRRQDDEPFRSETA